MKKYSLKHLQALLAVMFIALMGAAFSSCGGSDDDDDEPPFANAKGEWYVSPGGFATASDFTKINRAIDNHELLSDYGKYGQYYAEADLFFYDNGMWNDSDAHFGHLRFAISNSCVNIIHIIDEVTAEFYIAYLYRDAGSRNSEGEDRIWQFNAKGHFGRMAYYVDNPRILTYALINNTLILSNGDTFIKTSSGLKGDGGTWQKFTPTF